MDGGLLETHQLHLLRNKRTTITKLHESVGVVCGRMLSVATGGDTSVPQQQLTAVYPSTTTTTNNPDNDQAQFEADKRAVYKHPLFPLLALLFERCELATQSSDPQSSDAFNMDIQAFVQHQERDRKPFLSNEPEIDGLMIKAIQVLRIHLLELEKVQELCKDFCNRYITCLKGKMQSENLLRSDYPGSGGVGGGLVGMESNNNMIGGHGGHSDTGSESNSPVQYSISPQASIATTPQLDQRHSQQQQQQQVDMAFGLAQYAAQQQATHQQLQAAAALVAPPSVATSCENNPLGVVHGSTPLSQIGAGLCSVPASESSGPLSPAPTTPGASGDDCDSDFASSRSNSNYRKQKRGVLPKQATSVMRSWLFQHLVHPYPTEDEKRHIAAQTNLTLLQVNNWFINARRRILQPMLDASAPNNDASGVPSENSPSSGHKKKRSSGQNNNRRFWPQDFANMQPQIDGGLLSSSDDEGDSYSSDGEDANLVIDAHAQMQRQAQENGHGAATTEALQFSNSPEEK